MPQQHGRRRHPAQFVTRSTHSGFRPNFMGGARRPSVEGGALGSMRQIGLDYGEARDGEQAQYPDIGPEAVDGGVHIRPRSITRPLFAEAIVPPEVLDALPSLPDGDYPQGSLVFLTTDEKLYRNTDGSTWSVAVDGEDIIANSITAGQIAAGAIGTTELAADAVIANVINAGGTVTIDDTGITIEDGALTLVDDFGVTVLTGGGFSSTWLDFITYGIYNAVFSAGSEDTNIPASIVGSAENAADYAASLSDDLPYWVVESSSGAFQRETHAGTFMFPVVLTWRNAHARIFQDVPVHPGQDYGLIIDWSVDTNFGLGGFTRTVGFQWMTSEHEPIDSMAETGLAFTPATDLASVESVGDTLAIGPAPDDARFLRIAFEIDRDMVNDTIVVRLNGVRLQPIRTFGPVYIDSSVDASLSSDSHPLTIGSPSGANLAFDSNEIMARNNGAAANLNVNADGGDVRIGANGSGLIEFTENGNIHLDHGFITIDDYTSLPGAADAGSIRLFADISGGKMRFRVRWPSGTTTIATEP